jgi:hypothetical protein
MTKVKSIFAFAVAAMAFASIAADSGIEQATNLIYTDDRAKACEEALEKAEHKALISGGLTGTKAITSKKCDCAKEDQKKWVCIGFVNWQEKSKK